MTWVDVAVLGVLAVSGFIGVLRGLVREVLGIAAWVGALLIAVWVRPLLRGEVLAWLPTHPDLAGPIAFALGFLGTLIVLLVLTHLIARFVHRIGLGGLDRSLGLVFGLARGAALVILAYILVQMVIPIEQWPADIQHARSLPFAYQGAVWAVGWLPPAERPRITPPPDAPAPSARALMQALPRGLAVGTAPPPPPNQESR